MQQWFIKNNLYKCCLKKIVILNMINFFNDEILLIKKIKISCVLISTFFNEVRYLTSSILFNSHALNNIVL